MPRRLCPSPPVRLSFYRPVSTWVLQCILSRVTKYSPTITQLCGITNMRIELTLWVHRCGLTRPAIRLDIRHASPRAQTSPNALVDNQWTSDTCPLRFSVFLHGAARRTASEQAFADRFSRHSGRTAQTNARRCDPVATSRLCAKSHHFSPSMPCTLKSSRTCSRHVPCKHNHPTE
jgi:hypothetical protein